MTSKNGYTPLSEMPTAMLKKFQSAGSTGLNQATGIFDEFLKFVNRGSVVDVAVGFVLGNAFTSVVMSLVNDIIGPFIALATPQSGLKNMFLVLRSSSVSPEAVYPTLQEAQANGVVTWNYGNFLSTTINFLLISIIVFFLVKVLALIMRTPILTTNWPCPKCREDVKEGAVRCPHCAAEPIWPEDSGAHLETTTNVEDTVQLLQ